MAENTLIVTESTLENYGCFIDRNPEQMSDFRDSSGRAATVVLQSPLAKVLLAVNLHDDLVAALGEVIRNGYIPSGELAPEGRILNDKLRSLLARAKVVA